MLNMQLPTPRTEALCNNLEPLYEQQRSELLFHGWHHILFVTAKALEFSHELPVDQDIVAAAALTHDLNYLVDTTVPDPANDGGMRAEQLRAVGFDQAAIAHVGAVVLEAHTATRDADISNEAKALSDGDSLFKVMPVGPILFSNNFIRETKVDLRAWAERILREQKPLFEQGIYFYTEAAKKYLPWVRTNLELVEQVLKALDDTDITEMLAIARKVGVI